MTSVLEDNARMQERAKLRECVANQMKGKTLAFGIDYSKDNEEAHIDTDEVDCVSLNGVKYVKAIDLLKNL